ncbi:MAG: copper chaperone PCu(A)C [Pseudomonadales bacterium]|nr:copper chaperone PCu(A)C [Pseudomonadales bacterium]
MSTVTNILIVSLLLGGNAVLAATAEDISVDAGYVRGLPPGQSNTAAYMTIRNHSSETLVLTGARTDIASGAAVHNTEQHDGMMSMKPVPLVPVPARGEVVLDSGGLHLMLTGLKAPLDDAQQVRLTLLFQDGLEKTITLPVRSVLMEHHEHSGH